MVLKEILKNTPKGISRSKFGTDWIGQSTKLNSKDHCRLLLLLPLFIYFILFFITQTHQSKIIWLDC